MNLNGNTKKFTDTVVITAMMVLFGFLGYYTFPILSILYPVPAIVLGVRDDVKYSILSIIASSIIIGIITDLFTGAFMLVLFGLLGVSMTYMISKKYKAYEVIIGASVIYIVSIFIGLNIIEYIGGMSFISQIDTSLKETLELQMNSIRNMELSIYEVSQIGDLLESTINLIAATIPALIVISSVFIVYINYWVTGTILKRLNYSSFKMPSFTHFSLPQNIIVGTGIIFLATWILKYFKIFYYETILINVAILVFFIFFLQGLSLLLYLMHKRSVNKALRVILIVFLIIYSPLSLIIAFIGLIDSAFNFRKLKKSND